MLFLRALFAFLIVPGVVAFLLPLLIAAVDPWRGAVWTPGLVPVLVGAFVLLWCVRDFYAAGKGTLAPWSPPKKLVTVGLYRLVRNPMYVGVLTLVAGWSLYFSSFLLGAYALFLAIRFHMHVRSYEEPWLASQFGAEWEAYKAAVPRWRPRLQPWDNGS
ncbi:MAG: isoprenylcysteine carboxylmethyltransferase family protein [Chloroflexota bacterium]